MKKLNQKYRIFGRSLGRSNKKVDLTNFNQQISNYKISKIKKSEDYILDIGSGYGETSIFFANKYNQIKIIACDKYINGHLTLLKHIKEKNLKNIFIHNGNVYEILDKFKFQNIFNYVCVFFPDPWPKKKHNKRRIISDNFLQQIYFYLKRDAKLYIATDSISYMKTIFKCLYNQKNIYEWVNQEEIHLGIKYHLNIETKFYKKAIIKGKNPTLFILKKI